MAHKANRRFRAAFFVWRARVAHLEARASAESSTQDGWREPGLVSTSLEPPFSFPDSMPHPQS